MAEDVVGHAATLAGLDARRCVTRNLAIHGFHLHAARYGELAHYGSEAPEVEALIASDPRLAARVHPRLPARMGQVVWAVRREMARTVDDVLARRTRSLLIDARAAMEAAPAVARLMAEELGRGEDWVRGQVDGFTDLARRYLPRSA
jgi:glycerol-3-phosphate dehydrogenase